MSSLWHAYVKLDGVEFICYVGDGETIGEAINNIAYCDDNGHQYTIMELVEKCEKDGTNIEILVWNTAMPNRFICKPRDTAIKVVYE